MKLHELLKLINKRTHVVVKCIDRSKAKFYAGEVETEVLHDGELRDMNFEKFFDAMYYEVNKIYLKFGCIYIECHPKYKD
jgi:hypothetical protein